MNLWPHQARTLDETLPAAFTAGHKRVCLYGPCGCGKTTIIAEICRRAASKGFTVTITAHRRRLIKQLAERLKALGVRYTVVMANLPDEPWALVDPAANVVIGSRDTMLANMALWRFRRTKLWILDEAHCIAGRGYQALGDAIDPENVIGLTATPCHQDGSGFGPNLFTALVKAATIEELIADELLVPVDAYAPVGSGKRRREGLKPGLSGDPVKQWLTHAEGLKTLTLCRTLAECRTVQRMFAQEMIPAEHIDGDADDRAREEAIARLERGETKVLVCTPGLMGVGVDIPSIECVQTLVKNISPIPFWQSIGRGQRISPGKSRAVLLDHGAAVYEHGMPNYSPSWALGPNDSVQYRQAQRMQADSTLRPVVCPACGYISTSGVCPRCQTIVRTRTARKVKTDRENLEQFGEDGVMGRFQIEWRKILYQCAAKGFLVKVAVARFHRRFGKWPNELQVDPVPARSQYDLLVAEVWPQFVRSKV
jgi:superfamily II DNA or RNA helicase